MKARVLEASGVLSSGFGGRSRFRACFSYFSYQYCACCVFFSVVFLSFGGWGGGGWVVGALSFLLSLLGLREQEGEREREREIDKEIEKDRERERGERERREGEERERREGEERERKRGERERASERERHRE